MSPHILLLSSVFLTFILFSLVLAVIESISKRYELTFVNLSLLSNALYAATPVVALLNWDITYATYIQAPLKLLAIPFFYLYLLKLVTFRKGISYKDLLHFLPFLIELVISVTMALRYSHSMFNIDWVNHEYMKLYIPGNIGYNWVSVSGRILVFLQTIVYFVLIIRHYNKYLKVFLNERSDISYRNFGWMKTLIVLFFLELILKGGDLTGMYNFTPFLILSFALLLVFGVFVFAISIMQYDMSYLEEFVNQEDQNNENLDFNPDSEMIRKFEHEFTEKKLFLNPELTLQIVSSELNYGKSSISYFIKLLENENFNDFVNKKRVNYCIENLKNLPKGYTIESIAWDSGFKSRTTFYRAFNKYIGISPTDFLNSIK